MRKEYGKALRDLFTSMMAERLPQFSPYGGKSMYLAPGERVFQWPVSDIVHLFVFCVPDERGHEAFTVEIGWSTLSRLPELSMRPSFDPSENRKEFDQAEAVTRLPYLAGSDEWWTIEAISDPFSIEALMAKQEKLSTGEAKIRVKPFVADAMDLLLSTGMSYLNDFLEYRKISGT